jgi:hypothetical protein
MFANDVIAKCGNQTRFTMDVNTVAISPGTECDWNGGNASWGFTVKASIYVRPSGSNPNPFAWVSLFNPEVGYPTARVELRNRPYNDDYVDPGAVVRELMGEQSMHEGRIVSCDCPELGFRILIHRWGNGKEALDDYDEWYTRFYVAIQEL